MSEKPKFPWRPSSRATRFPCKNNDLKKKAAGRERAQGWPWDGGSRRRCWLEIPIKSQFLPAGMLGQKRGCEMLVKAWLWAVPPHAPLVGFGRWVWCFAAEKRGKVRPRLGLEWWQQEINELNHKILSPMLDVCHLLPRGISDGAFPEVGLSPVPCEGAEMPSEDTRMKVLAQSPSTGLPCLGLLVGQHRDINHETLPWRRD